MRKSKIDKFEVINNSVITIAEKRGCIPAMFSEDEDYNLKIEIKNLTKSQYKDILDKIENIVEG